MADDSTLLGSIPKGKSNEIRFQLERYRGKTYLDIRVFFLPKDGNELRPTKKGVKVNIEDIPTLLDLVGKAMSAAPSAEPSDGSTNKDVLHIRSLRSRR